MESAEAASADATIAIAVLTCNRVHLLRRCVENVLLRTSDATTEIVIWDNGSTDGTRDYLATITDPRVDVVLSESNVGFNGYPRAFARTSAPLMIQLDDDVTDASQDWDRALRDAFLALPGVGFLAADLVDDYNDLTSRYRHHIRPHEYTEEVENGVRLLIGPSGSYCAMTSRALNEEIGGFKEREGEIFWLEDTAYIQQIEAVGQRAATFPDLVVHHTGGAYYAEVPAAKAEFWDTYWAEHRRREAIKRVLVRVPFVARLNARHNWFVPPEPVSTAPEA
jgi:O-antigen biosynthesis protein